MAINGVPLLDVQAQYKTVQERVEATVLEVMRSGRYILGPKVEEFEKQVGVYCSSKFSVAVSSGTDAILMALMAENIGPGDEVITSPYTFFATAGCVHRVGAKPVFVDIDPKSYNIDPAKIEKAITKKTRAIMPVHVFGQCAEMDAILEIAKKHKLLVIEDAAQAIGSEYKGRRAGSMGDYGCFSFFPSKNLGCLGDGGLVTTQDAAKGERLSLMRNHGMKPKYHHLFVGGNFRIDALQAAVLTVKLESLDAWTKARQQNAADYRKLLAPLEAAKKMVLPPELPSRRHIYNQFCPRILNGKRDLLRDALQKANIGCEIYYPVPLHVQECFASLGYAKGSMPESERAAEETIAIPIYSELTSEQKNFVAAKITEVLA